MRILALDTATRTGYAIRANDIVTSGVFDASIRTKATKTFEADHPGKRFHRFQHWVREQIRGVRPNIIVYERIVGGSVAGGSVALIQKGLEALVITEAYRAGEDPVKCWTFAAGTIKKWGTGSGLLNKESKQVMVRNAFAKFTDQEWVMKAAGPDDNQADALWILDLAYMVVLQAALDGIGLENFSDEDLTRVANIVTAKKWSPVKKA